MTSHTSGIVLVFVMLQHEETQLASWEFQTASMKTALLLDSPVLVICCPFVQFNIKARAESQSRQMSWENPTEIGNEGGIGTSFHSANRRGATVIT